MIGAYVLGGLPEDQRTGLLAHIDGCPDCRADAAELAEVAARSKPLTQNDPSPLKLLLHICIARSSLVSKPRGSMPSVRGGGSASRVSSLQLRC